MPVRSGPQDEAAVEIGAFDEILVAHLEIDPWMAERAAAPIAAYAGFVHFDRLGHFDGHGLSWCGKARDNSEGSHHRKYGLEKVPEQGLHAGEKRAEKTPASVPRARRLPRPKEAR